MTSLGGLTLTVDTTPGTVTGTASLAFGGAQITVTSGLPSVALFDESGNWLTNLPTAAGIVWQHELSAPGSLACRVPVDDAAALTPKRILKVFWRGKARQAARIDSSGVTVAVDGRRWREFSLPGILAATGDGLVFPEVEILSASATQRSFGPMSVRGPWLNVADWVVPIAIKWSDETDVKRGRPEGLDFPNPSWIAENGPHAYEAPGTVQWFRRKFTLASEIKYQILATGDNNLTLYLDGEQLIAPDAQQGLTWTVLVQVTGDLQPGAHVLAAKVSNGVSRVAGSYNPMALILTLQQLQSNGDVVVGTPLVNSDTTWRVSNVPVGFRRADVLATLYAEALARSVKAFQVLSIGFTHDRDSRGVAWTDTPGEYGLDTMTTFLDAVGTLTEKTLDVDVDFDTLTINAYNRAGADLYSTVKLDVGVGRTGSLVDHRVDRVEAKFNTALVQKADGTYAEIQDAASLATYGRIETGLQLGSTSDTDTAAEVATAAFAESADTAYTITSTASALGGKQLYRDWTVGDSIGVPDDTAAGYLKVRVLSVTVDASKDGAPVITPELVVDRT